MKQATFKVRPTDDCTFHFTTVASVLWVRLYAHLIGKHGCHICRHSLVSHRCVMQYQKLVNNNTQILPGFFYFIHEKKGPKPIVTRIPIGSQPQCE